MQLTGKEIIGKGIISNYTEEAIQQQGIDVRLESIAQLDACNRWFAGPMDKCGYIPMKGKTTIPKTTNEDPEFINNVAGPGNPYTLTPGYYEVTLMEGCEIPANATLHFKTRSSLVRCGAIVHSGQFDAGFKTDKMGCFLQVMAPIKIEKGARIAQALVFTSNDVENLYDGQWQNDKQRK